MLFFNKINTLRNKKSVRKPNICENKLSPPPLYNLNSLIKGIKSPPMAYKSIQRMLFYTMDFHGKSVKY